MLSLKALLVIFGLTCWKMWRSFAKILSTLRLPFDRKHVVYYFLAMEINAVILALHKVYHIIFLKKCLWRVLIGRNILVFDVRWKLFKQTAYNALLQFSLYYVSLFNEYTTERLKSIIFTTTLFKVSNYTKET